MAQAPQRRPINEEYAEGLGYYDESGNFRPPKNTQSDNINRQPSKDFSDTGSLIQNITVAYREKLPETPVVANQNKRLSHQLAPQPEPASDKNGLEINTATTTTLAKIEATPIIAHVFAWSAWWWLWVQLPFAIISAFAFTAASYVDNQNGLLEAAGELFTNVTNLFGIDFLNWTALFIITWVVVWSASLFCLGAGLIQYSLVGIRPLFGRGATLKTSMFLLVCLGSVVPIANMIPWIFLWIAAVFYYPK
jgi:hypothetical protein